MFLLLHSKKFNNSPKQLSVLFFTWKPTLTVASVFCFNRNVIYFSFGRSAWTIKQSGFFDSENSFILLLSCTDKLEDTFNIAR